jgi:plastocyanin
MNTGKQINAMVVLLLLLLLGVGAYTLWDPFRAEAETERTREAIMERATTLYILNCQSCHGKAGEGRIGPALSPEGREAAQLPSFADPAKLKENQALVRNTLVCGRIGKIMPPWALDQGGSLNDEQIRQLVFLMTDPTENAWKHLAEEAEAEAEAHPLQPVEEITANASVTGAAGQVCGQLAPPTATPETGPVEVKTNWQEIATDNKFNFTRIGVPANQEVTLSLQNNGKAVHNWVVRNAKGPDGKDIGTDILPGGQSQTIRFTIATPGNYQFLCTIHPTEMVGTLVVQ